MRRGQLTALVIQPSFFSGIVTFACSALLLGAANWPSLMDQPLLHDYFLGDNGVVTLLKTSNSEGSSPLSAVFSQNSLNNSIMLIAALIIGLVVLFVLEAIRRYRENAVPISRHEGRVRFGTRLLVGFLWLAFALVTLKVILPFCILASNVGVKLLWQSQSVAYIAFGVALLWACLHLHVIFMRLFVLRVRVFGGEEAIMQAELDR